MARRSDIRLKKNIVALQPASELERLMLLNPVQYEWKDPRTTSGVQYGFVAQEVEKVSPELVSTADNEDKTKSVSYINMIASLVASVQELATAQKADFARLKAENEALKAANDNHARELQAIREEIRALKESR